MQIAQPVAHDAATLHENIQTSQKKAFRTRTREAKQPYTSDATLELIRERQEAPEGKGLDTEWRLNKSVRNSIRRDKKKYWAEQLEKGDWQEVKVTKQGFMPKFTKIRDEKGVVVPSSKRPDILADRFEKK